MNSQRKSIRMLAGPVLVVAIASLGLISTSGATGNVEKADLSGPWAITLSRGYGLRLSTSMLATGSLDTNGQGSVTLHFHSAGCGNSTSTEKFAVQTLNANGSGTRQPELQQRLGLRMGIQHPGCPGSCALQPGGYHGCG